MNTAHLRATLRAKQSAILAAIQRAMPNASAEPRPVRGQKEMAEVFEHRIGAWADRCGEVTLADSGSRYTVTNSRESLAEFAAEITKSTGFRLTPKRAIPRESDRRASLKPADEAAAKTRYGSTSTADLRECIAAIKADFVKTARQCWQGGQCNDALAAGKRIEYMQRELVRRGELSATDMDLLNAEPTHEEIDAPSDTATVPLFASEPAETSAPCDPPAPDQPEPAANAADAAVTAAPEASEPAEPSPELVTMKTCYGGTVRILASDLNGTSVLIRTFRRDGTQKVGKSIHRDNLDPDGAKRAAMSIPPEIGRKGARSERDYGFRTYAGAERAIAKAGFGPAQFTIERYRYGGFIAVRINPERPKPTGATPPAAAKPRLRYCWTAAEWRKAGDAAVKASEPAAPEKASDAAEPTGPRPEVAPTIVQHKRGSAIVQCRSTDGWKTRTDRLAEALGVRWVHKRNGYVMSASAAARLAMLHASGADASVFTRNITSATGQPINKRTGRVVAPLH